MELGNKLKEARSNAGLKQEELANHLGVSRQTVSNWENNRSYPDIASILKLSDLYGLSLDELLKEDKKVQEHFENRAAKKRHFWQLALEYGIVAEIIGTLLLGQDFTGAGSVILTLGVMCTWIALWVHIKLFDHSAQELRLFVSGFIIIFLGGLAEILFPDFLTGTSPIVPVFLLFRTVGPLLILFSNVWSQFWKSPRFALILVFLLGVPFFNFMTTLQDSGTLNEKSPFGQDYRIEQILYPENKTPDPAIRVDLHRFADSHSLRIYKNGDDYNRIGTFTYQQPTENQEEKGIWLLTPEDNPKGCYRLAAESDGRITLSYSEEEQLQWKWLLREEYICSISIATFGHTIYTNPDWLLPEEADPEPYFKSTDVVGTATLTIAIPGLESETLTLTEEYHHGDSVEYTEHILQAVKPNAFAMELKTRYDGIQEYAVYKIAYKGGDFRFVLTYDLGAADAFQNLIR